MVQKSNEAIDKSQHCHTCRRQRLRCDGVRPTCNKCVARGVDCLGYGTQALLWVQPQAQQGKRQQGIPGEMVMMSPTEMRQQGGGSRKKGRPKLVLMQRTSSELALPNGEGMDLTKTPKTIYLNAYRKEMNMRGFRNEFLQRRKIVLSPSLDPEGYQLQRLLIDSLRYCRLSHNSTRTDYLQFFSFKLPSMYAPIWSSLTPRPIRSGYPSSSGAICPTSSPTLWSPSRPCTASARRSRVSRWPPTCPGTRSDFGATGFCRSSTRSWPSSFGTSSGWRVRWRPW